MSVRHLHVVRVVRAPDQEVREHAGNTVRELIGNLLLIHSQLLIRLKRTHSQSVLRTDDKDRFIGWNAENLLRLVVLFNDGRCHQAAAGSFTDSALSGVLDSRGLGTTIT